MNMPRTAHFRLLLRKGKTRGTGINAKCNLNVFVAWAIISTFFVIRLQFQSQLLFYHAFTVNKHYIKA